MENAFLVNTTYTAYPKYVKKLIGTWLIILWFLLFIDGSFQQFQMFIFDNRVPIPTITLKLSILLILLFALLLKPLICAPKKLIFYWYLLIVYLSSLVIYFVYSYNYTISYIIFTFNAYYFYIIILPLIFDKTGYIKEKRLVKIILVLFLPLSFLGLYQHFMVDPVLNTASSDGYFLVYSWAYYEGTVRAFSLFSSAYSFGHYISLVGAISFVLILFTNNKKNKFAYLILFLLSVITCYATLTRNTYIMFFFTLLSCFIIIKFKNIKLIKILPFIYGSLGIILAYVGPVLVQKYFSSNLFATDSLYTRFSFWKKYIDVWSAKGISSILFGTGLIQNERFDFTKEVVLDNTFLGIAFHIGVLGLLIWIIIMLFLYRFLCNKIIENPTPLGVAVTAFYSTWIITSIYNINSTTYILMFILFILSSHDLIYKKDGVAKLEYKLEVMHKDTA